MNSINMKKIINLNIVSIVLIFLACLPVAQAQLSGNLNVDNEFEAYISTDDAVEGTFIASGTDWRTTYSLSSSLVAGQDYYLHIKAANVNGPSGYLGDFALSGTDHTFANGSRALNTDTTNWFVSTAGWRDYELATSYGSNGDPTWGTQSSVDSSAEWIWSSVSQANSVVYFSTKISAVNKLPLAEYRFEEDSWDGSSNEILDNSGNGHHATINNNSALAFASPARLGNPGTCSYVSQDDGSIEVTGLPLDTTTDGVKTTVTFWMNWDGTNNVMPIGWDRHDIWLINGIIGFNTWNVDIYGTSSSDLANGWHHIAVEFTNGAVASNRMHINGELKVLTQQFLDQGFQTPNNTNAFVNSELRIGGVSNSTNYDFHGELDEVRVYQSALTTAEVQAIMAEGHACQQRVSVPVVEYRFDACSLPGTAGDVFDQSGSFNASSNNIPSPTNEAVVNNALNLTTDNTSDWLDVPSNAVDGLQDLSLAVWFKTDINKAQQEIFQALGTNASDDELEIYLKDNDTVVVKIRDTSIDLASNILFADNNWHHLAVTRDRTEVCLYIDGALQSCDDIGTSGDLDVSNSNAVIIGQEQDEFGGGFSVAQNFEGQLDEFKLFDDTLSNSQVISIYQNELAGLNYDGTAREAALCDLSCSAGTLNAVGIILNGSGSDSEINTVTEALAIHAAWIEDGSPESGLIDGGNYNVATSASSRADRIDFGGLDNDYSGTLRYPVNRARSSDFLVHTSGGISLPAGEYTIYVESDDGFSFVMDRVSGDAVSFNKFGRSTAGASNELRFEGTTANTQSGGSFTLSQDSVFNIAAIFFERSGEDFLEISIANNILTSAPSDGYEVLRNGALGGKVQFVCVTPSVIDHYQIIHDGQGLTCAAETVTINACTNAYDGSCTLSEEPVTLDVIATGTTTVTDSISFTGTGSASIAYTAAESVLLSLENASTTAANSVVCFDGSTTSCNMLFADAGFRFLNGSSGTSDIISNQISGTSFPLRLQAVNNVDGVCEGLFTGNKAVDLSQQNLNPTGSAGLNFSVDGNNIAKHQSSTSTTLNFGADSIATIPTAIYHDAGQIRLHANYSVGGIELSGSSNAFWVSPAQLLVSATSGSTVLNGANATATPVHKAGENFDLTVTAVNSLGVTTPNYSPGQIQFQLARSAPLLGGSVDGSLTYAAASNLSSSASPTFQDVTLSAFSSGVSSFNAAHYSEVGVLTLDVQDSNYGNANIVIPTTAINIGRFIPHHFEQTIAEAGVLATKYGSSVAFVAYSGQKDEASNSVGAISYLTNPVLEITAYNKQGSITRNYYQDSEGSANDFMKLSAADISIALPTADGTAVGVDATALPLSANMSTGTLSQNDLTILTGVVALPRGVLHYQLSDADHFFYNRSANALVAPFTSDIDFAITAITDTDNVAATATVAASPTGVEVRFGRLLLENSFGPETSDFPQAMQIQYFDGTQFIASADENNVSYDPSQMSLTNMSLDPDLSAILGNIGQFTNGKTGGLSLQAPGAGNQGQIGVSYDTFDWFDYDWDGDGVYDESPTAVATFGIYRGNDRIIHWREVFN